MKSIIKLALAIALNASILGCATYSQPVRFYDASSCEYRITSLRQDIHTCYGEAFPIEHAVLVAAQSDSQIFREQLKTLAGFDWEKERAILITALADKANNDGYHTDVTTAQDLLGGHHFTIQLYSHEGDLLAESNERVDLHWIQSHQR
ncbi:hypothetical protein EUZ85_29255 [Hahella sp. KA22]|uniref:hypothetical protein n=1 Tax=Hahella sp. KA22 TaxID=1628392 RepID=UPI000FDD35A0|nr:hypothetical protein [Hahella sp. KA22]AZZ94585.1 hypothetical protein ENC22_26670 [Hahella sp. KA22]QAY57958.1 hypothetical protein EUZ85_29255 [Hahella sp. KA22]